MELQSVSNSSDQKRPIHRKSRLPQTFKQMLVKQSQIRYSSNSSQSYKNLISSLYSNLIDVKKCQLCQIQYKDLLNVFYCNHRFCMNCLKSYVQYKISLADNLVCPQQNCFSLIDEEGVFFEQLPQQTLTKYFNNKLWKQNINNPELRLCPNEDCRQGLIDLKLNPPQCRKCKRKCCRLCQMDYHQGLCEQNFQHIFNQWKRCPQCKVFIDKIDGCNHVICLCNHQFCFICLDNWSDDHYQCFQPSELQIPPELSDRQEGREIEIEIVRDRQEVRERNNYLFEVQEEVPQITDHLCYKIIGILLLPIFMLLIGIPILIICILTGIKSAIGFPTQLIIRGQLPFLVVIIFLPLLTMIGFILGICQMFRLRNFYLLANYFEFFFLDK